MAEKDGECLKPTVSDPAPHGAIRRYRVTGLQPAAEYLPVCQVIQEHYTRRRLIATGTISALGLAGLALGSGNARAAVSLDIEDRTYAPENGTLFRPWVVVSGDFSYTNLDAEASEWAVYGLVDGPDATGEDWQAIAIDDGLASGTEGSGTYQLRGAITSHSGWDASRFSANEDGSPQSLDIPVAVMLVLRDSGGNIIADAEAHQTATVTVEAGGAVLSVAGTGAVEAQLSSEDPTPTYAGGA